MLGKNCFRKITTSLTAAAVLCVYSMVGLAATKDLTGEITVTGQVSVNGQSQCVIGITLDRVVYLVMEMIDGTSLRRLMEAELEPLTAEDVDAIEAAHAEIDRGESVEFADFASQMRAKFRLKRP